MEVQIPQQSVQINLNNKIITLHNVTIVKNPRIVNVKVDAAQYSNLLLRGANGPIKFVTNGATATATSLKLPVPSLVPMSKVSTVTPLKFASTTVPVQQQTPVIQTVIKQAQVVKQPSLSINGIFPQLKPTLYSALASPAVTKIQTVPVVKSQPTVIISPPKVVPSPPKQQISHASSNEQIKVHFQPPAANQTSVITKPPVLVSPQPVTHHQNGNSSAILPIQTKVIVSPPSLKKQAPVEEEISKPPSPKKSKLEFQCMFCERVFIGNPQQIIDHTRFEHPEKIPSGKGEAVVSCEIKQEPELLIPDDVKVETSSSSSSSSSDSSNNESSSDSSSTSSDSSDTSSDDEMSVDDDDASEVNGLINDLEELEESTQDTQVSTQERSNTPESPEFEEHVPSQNFEAIKEIKEEIDDFFTAEDDEYEWELLAFLLEPYCDLQYEHGSDEDLEENEAMRLYREAMEINYQQNGIKKRGRRKQRTPKVPAAQLAAPDDLMNMNGILANLLDPTIKIPQGPGRGRRKETNEQELEQDRNNGVCFFQCTQCDKSFKYAGDLAKHVRSHTISSPYRCSICKKVFTHIGSLNTHLRIHSGERPYKCKFCDKSFTQSNSLMVHVKSHLSNKPFSCNQCNKGFLNASSLAVHQKTHNGPLAAVVCPIETCGKEFRDNNLLEEHMQTHKQSMLYQCSLCLEKFEQAAQLVQHVKSHIGDKPFQCTICSRSFTQPGSLNTHLRIHTGEKPFSCALCPKRFTQASSLSVHMKIHGEKEFKCDVCEKSYSQEAFLLKHKLKHKEEDHQNTFHSALSDGMLEQHQMQE